ncbi:Uncharacterised protein [Alloiococcus otitis]|uniref:hypothetical protein n=1 Tax=Alloiococcus otitis TaxID=1652 RepID=UPI000E137282|nr:hypothetical protein [Alloiococcus otitis]SUU80693.1 Uncharacterised protein [Alloiococcus otitis]
MDKNQEVKDQQQVDESTDEQVDTQEDQSTEKEEKTFTQDEVEKLIKGNVDRQSKRLTKMLSKPSRKARRGREVAQDEFRAEGRV